MVQIFLKSSKIKQADWEKAYQGIRSIVTKFPTKIIRLESYTGYENKLDKIHFDLVVDKNTPLERISFWGDWMSYTGKGNLEFYKNWEKQLELASTGAEVDLNKSVYWFKDIPYKNDGDIPSANGILPFPARYLDTEEAHYQSVIIAIGVFLENMFPDAAFLTVLWGDDYEEVEIVIEWLEQLFKKSFKKPVYYDRKQLLDLLRNEYDNEEAIICRMAHLYRKKHKTNMQFAIQHIGYETTLSFYSKILADTGFGTYGFLDVLNPWISVTQDLEATLELISESKKLLLEDKSNEYRIKEAENYDLTYLLKKLLNNYILWTPLQRKALAHFDTNKDNLEEKEEGIFEAIKTIMGYQVEITPMYADERELFEAFMFHDPKNGHQYKHIIDEWKVENSGSYEKLKQEIEIQRQQFESNSVENYQVNEVTNNNTSQHKFLYEFAPHDRYFVRKALNTNPLFTEVEKSVEAFKSRVISVIKEHSDQEYRDEVLNLPKATSIKYIKSRIREIGYSVHPDFEKWLEAIDNEEILFYLHFAMALKLFDRNAHFSRFRFLWDRNYWTKWD